MSLIFVCLRTEQCRGVVTSRNHRKRRSMTSNCEEHVLHFHTGGHHVPDGVVLVELEVTRPASVCLQPASVPGRLYQEPHLEHVVAPARIRLTFAGLWLGELRSQVSPLECTVVCARIVGSVCSSQTDLCCSRSEPSHCDNDWYQAPLVLLMLQLHQTFAELALHVPLFSSSLIPMKTHARC